MISTVDKNVAFVDDLACSGDVHIHSVRLSVKHGTYGSFMGPVLSLTWIDSMTHLGSAIFLVEISTREPLAMAFALRTVLLRFLRSLMRARALLDYLVL